MCYDISWNTLVNSHERAKEQKILYITIGEEEKSSHANDGYISQEKGPQWV